MIGFNVAELNFFTHEFVSKAIITSTTTSNQFCVNCTVAMVITIQKQRKQPLENLFMLALSSTHSHIYCIKHKENITVIYTHKHIKCKHICWADVAHTPVFILFFNRDEAKYIVFFRFAKHCSNCWILFSKEIHVECSIGHILN